jgi:hypothetical protein
VNEALALAAGLVLMALAAFVASVRLGILLGRRLDHSIEERRREENRGD